MHAALEMIRFVVQWCLTLMDMGLVFVDISYPVLVLCYIFTVTTSLRLSKPPLPLVLEELLDRQQQYLQQQQTNTKNIIPPMAVPVRITLFTNWKETKIWSNKSNLFSTRKSRLEIILLPLLELTQNPRKSVRKYWLFLLWNDVLLLQQIKEIQYRKQQIIAANNNKPVMMNSCFS